MRGDKNFLKIIKAARINRSLPTVSIILFASAFANKINLDIISLAICSVLLYAPGGLLNAIKDKDYKLPKYTKLIILALPITAIIISLHNKILLLATLSWILTGFIYNIASRKIILLDTTILSITHYFIPAFFSLLILKISTTESLLISTYIYLTLWFIPPIKNLNGIQTDKKLKYKTLPTTYKNGKQITILLYHTSFIMMTMSYFIFNLNPKYFIFLSILLLTFIASQKSFNLKNKSIMLGFARLKLSLFPSTLALFLTQKPEIIIPCLAIPLSFLITLVKQTKKEITS